MNKADGTTWNSYSSVTAEGQWPGVDSIYRLVMVAAQRSKQLQRGARPRIQEDPKRRRNTSIALEEVKLGLVPFINNTKEGLQEGDDGHAAQASLGDTSD
jgi:DNA-directed RNA polymerase omega subunit